MSSLDRLNSLGDSLKKQSIKFENAIYETLEYSIKNLIDHKLVLPKDAIQMADPSFKRAAFNNWKIEPQYSSRCPECMIDIPGPRKLMWNHLKVHQSKKDHIKENEPWNQNFRIHF